MSATPSPFDVADDFSGVTTVVEASAGTGKTYALSGLAVRMLADGVVTTSQILVVTFTRAATAELRSRIRERLVDACTFLDGSMDPGDDGLFGALAESDAAQKRQRLEVALSDFDEMTVSTIHGFAQQMLASMGAAVGVDPDLTLMADDDALRQAACADLLAIEADHGHAAAELPSLDELVSVVKELQNMPDLIIEPDPTAADESADPVALVRSRLATAAMVRIDSQRRAVGARGYGELLTDLRDALTGETGEAAIAEVRGRFRVALIDEFQDTDAIQWKIFATLFDHDPDASLVLVGDPKQAIYQFRGADIHTYMEVVSGDVDLRDLTTNWRADEAVIRSLGVVFDGAEFGRNIDFRPVGFAVQHRGHALRRSDGTAAPALKIRLALGADLKRNKPSGDNPANIVANSAAWAIRTDMAAQLIDLFDHHRLEDGTADGRAVSPGDVAVLTRTKTEAGEFARTLIDCGIPAVVLSGSSVLDTAAARQWELLLEAVALPSDRRRARAASLTCFGPFASADDLAGADEAALEDLQDRLQRWSEVLTTDGVAAFVRHVFSEASVAARVLVRPDGERLLTDLDQLADLFEQTCGTGPSSSAVLLAALSQPVTKIDVDDDPTKRRVETDADAVQIMTMHVSKGLEFPIVCCPGLYKIGPEAANHALYFDAERGQRVLDLEPKRVKTTELGGSAKSPRALAASENDEDRLRLLYVAMTRAQQQTIVWWSRMSSSARAPLTRLLYGRDTTGAIDLDTYRGERIALPDDDDALRRLDVLMAKGAGTIDVGVHGRANLSVWSAPGADHTSAPTLELAHLGHPLDRRANRWSFSAITAHEDPTSVQAASSVDPSVPIPPGGDEGTPEAEPIDGPTDATSTGAALTAALDDPTVSQLSTLPAGTAFGTLVHEILERVDFTDDELPVVVDDEITRELAWRTTSLIPVGLAGADRSRGRALLRDGLVGVITSPLGSAFDGKRLCDVGWTDRLSEMSFELHLTASTPPVSEKSIGGLLLDGLAADDPYRSWAESLATGRFGVDLAGHLTGSIDLIVRVGTPTAPRFVVVDYKTNRLHDRNVVPLPDNYGADRMADAMVQHHYPLQALLYSVALHRYLRWRLPGYEPAKHLGGAAYLFVRGMAGPEVTVTEGEPNGVCRWAIPAPVVVALSDLLSGVAGEANR